MGYFDISHHRGLGNRDPTWLISIQGYPTHCGLHRGAFQLIFFDLFLLHHSEEKCQLKLIDWWQFVHEILFFTGNTLGKSVKVCWFEGKHRPVISCPFFKLFWLGALVFCANSGFWEPNKNKTVWLMVDNLIFQGITLGCCLRIDCQQNQLDDPVEPTKH